MYILNFKVQKKEYELRTVEKYDFSDFLDAISNTVSLSQPELFSQYEAQNDDFDKISAIQITNTDTETVYKSFGKGKEGLQKAYIKVKHLILESMNILAEPISYVDFDFTTCPLCKKDLLKQTKYHIEIYNSQFLTVPYEEYQCNFCKREFKDESSLPKKLLTVRNIIDELIKFEK